LWTVGGRIWPRGRAAALLLGLAAVLLIPACQKGGEPGPDQKAATEAAAGSTAPQFKWKMQSLWQAGSINHKVFERFCQRVGEATGGRLEITPLPVGSIVAYNETLDAVGSGVLDGQQSGAAYFAGKDPAFILISEFPGGYETPWQMQAWFEYGGGKELARELYARFNVFYVGSVWHGMESIPSKRPLRGVDDLKGLKIRIPEGPNQEIFKRFGAAPVSIPGSEVYTSLDRGVIDATDWGTLGMNIDLGYHKIAPYQVFPGFHSLPMADVAVNLDRWKELPPDIRAILEMAVRDFARDMVEKMMVADAEAARKAEAEGVKLVTWNDAERRKFRSAAAQVMETVAQRGELARQIYDSHVTFLTRLGLLE
jgi:TRAP-type mannitol/chloroaromatic compound transport system substrate-binding protein